MIGHILAMHSAAVPRALADFWLPKAASNLAPDVDQAWNLILYVTGAFFCIVVGAMTFFVFKFRRKTPNDVTSTITHNTPLEIAWTFIPLVIVIAFFFVGFRGFLNYDTPASDCVNVDAQAHKWAFNFTYSNGATSPNLYLLVNQDVKINMTSTDVLHALYIPVMRTQRNFVPGRQTYIWFKPMEVSPKETGDKSEPGGWPIYCTQYCGNGHSQMTARVFVLSKPEYDEKMNDLANPFKKKMPDGSVRYLPYFEVGKQLYSEIGCNSCHSVDGSKTTGPTWKGMWKSETQFSFIVPGSFDAPDGKFTLGPSDSDEKWDGYLKESMLVPGAKLAIGGLNSSGMSDFSSQLSGSEINAEKQRALAEYIKSIGNLPYKAPDTTSDAWDAKKSPDHHPESLAAKRAATQSQPAAGQ